MSTMIPGRALQSPIKQAKEDLFHHLLVVVSVFMTLAFVELDPRMPVSTAQGCWWRT